MFIIMYCCVKRAIDRIFMFMLNEFSMTHFILQLCSFYTDFMYCPRLLSLFVCLVAEKLNGLIYINLGFCSGIRSSKLIGCGTLLICNTVKLTTPPIWYYHFQVFPCGNQIRHPTVDHQCLIAGLSTYKSCYFPIQ